jgi:putative PEP-CTERM system integral membrane protein
MLRRLPSIVFWGWNVLFCLSALLLLAAIGPTLLPAAFTGAIQPGFAVSLLMFLAVPVAAIVLASIRPKREPGFLLKLFFGVELPLVLLALFRLFVLRQLTPSALILLASILIVSLYFLRHCCYERFEVKGRAGAAVHSALAAVMAVIGVGCAAFLAIYAIPVAGMLASGLWSLITQSTWRDWIEAIEAISTYGIFGLFAVCVFLLTLASALVLIVAPAFVGFFYTRGWRHVLRKAERHLRPAAFAALSLGVAVLWVGVYWASGFHREATTVAYLSAQESLFSIRDEIDDDIESIRKDLLLAYLYPYRYLDSRSAVGSVGDLYRRAVHAPPAVADAAQSIHRFILTPLLYSGGRGDNLTAGRLYQEILDRPIQDAERAAIRGALKATWNRDQVEAGLLDIDARRVLLSEQHVRTSDLGLYAAVEIEEIYVNQTTDNQEIYYYFSLPEDAAITGLWLGFGADRSRHDAFVVAPRGAAQVVYQAERQVRVDPALLEQVGPHQYRLRVFPIPPGSRVGARIVSRDRERLLRMRFTYVIPRRGNAFELPELLEKRNIYWSARTRRTLNGERIRETDWLPSAVPASTPPQTAPLTVTLPEGFIVSASAPAPDDEPLELAVLVDTSYSMRAHDAALRATLRTLAAEPGVEAQLLLSGASGAPARQASLAQVEEEGVAYFGSLSPQAILAQHAEALGSRAWDAVLILTDQGLYASDATTPNPARSDAPLWFLHLGTPAFAYDDALLDWMYRTGGGAASSAEEALAGIRAGKVGARLSGGLQWTVTAPEIREGSFAAAEKTPLNALAARQVALSYGGRATDLATLDLIHNLAKAYEVVTPWSSMIVLVNERQREALEEASSRDDRFTREAETGEERLTSPVSGVPEPHEWMLIALAAAMLGALAWHRRWAGWP